MFKFPLNLFKTIDINVMFLQDDNIQILNLHKTSKIPDYSLTL